MNQILDGFPGVEDVSCGAPHAGTAFLHPFVCLISTPGACAEKDISAAVLQCQPHSAVQIFAGNDGAVVAVVVFEKINAPGGEGLCICKFVFIASGVSCTGEIAGTGIHAEFQPFTVYIVCYCFHAVRELGRVSNQSALCITFLE